MRARASFLSLSFVILAVLSGGCGDDTEPPPGNGGTGGSGGGGGGGNNANCVTAADDLIAQFKTDNGIDPVDGRSGGFYVYSDKSGTFTPPAVDGAAYPIDTTSGNTACSGPGSFHTKATGFKAWGAAVGVDFVPSVGGVKGFYNASKYKGVTFWAKGAAPITNVQVSFPDIYTDGAANPTPIDPATSPCVYTAGAPNNCSPYLVKLGDAAAFPAYGTKQIDTTWKRFDILFADTKQDPFNPGFHTAADKLDTAHLVGMAIQVNAIFSSGPPMANDFEIWIDDVAFIR